MDLLAVGSVTWDLWRGGLGHYGREEESGLGALLPQPAEVDAQETAGGQAGVAVAYAGPSGGGLCGVLMYVTSYWLGLINSFGDISTSTDLHPSSWRMSPS